MAPVDGQPVADAVAVGTIGDMRWSRLFDDLEGQLREQERAELQWETAEQTRAHRGQIELSDRLAADIGATVQVRARGGVTVGGVLEEVGAGWLVVHADVQGSARRRAVLIAVPGVLTVTGLSGRADPHQGLGRRRLDLRHALRAISRDRALCRLSDVDGGQLTGTLDRVGRDHLDLSDHPEDLPRRTDQVRRTITVPFSALVTLRQV